MHRIFAYNEPIAQVVQKHAKLVFAYPSEKIWNQRGVSLAQRIAADASLQAQVTRALRPATIERYLVPADDSAPTRCIDGRLVAGWTAETPQKLGPKVAGGTVHAALAYRIVDVENMRENLLFEEDIKQVINRFKRIGIGVGGHIDDHQTGANTGCGAVDNINLILDRLQRPEHQEQLRGLAQLILGDAYDGRTIVNEVIGRMLYLDALKPHYMPKEHDDPHGEFLYKHTIVDTIRQQADSSRESVPALTGPHHEVALVLNFIAGMTFDNDRFSHDHANQIQVFGWDIWHMYEEARRLYPYDMHESVATQREAVEKRIRYVTTRTLLGISTLMVLSDGSLRLITASA